MPIYEYECEKCGRITEALQGFNDPPLKRCKHCGGKVHRIISLSSFQLVGTGWYATDYAKNPGIPHKATSRESDAGKSEASEAKSSKNTSIANA